MYLFDVNVWVHTHREDAPDHASSHAFVTEVLDSGKPFAYSHLALSGFIRIVTHPRIFREPTSLEMALKFVHSVTSHPLAVAAVPQSSHWHLFTHLCLSANARGNYIPDAYLAALALSGGYTWVTTDRDYIRFPGLNCKII